MLRISKLFYYLGTILVLLHVASATDLNQTTNFNYSNPQAFIQKISVGSYFYYMCYPNPCQNGGICSTNGIVYSCQCQNGYSGPNCETYNSVSNCIYNPCPGGSQCTRQSNGNYYCSCPNGYYGPYCLSTSYVCNPNPCYNGGVCVQTGPTIAQCNCPVGYTGSLCETAIINPCQNNPCQNGGVCTVLYLSSNSYSYKCTCINGFGGYNCDTVYNPCSSNGCPCQNGGLCNVNWSTYPYYSCTCINGYSGPNCQTFPNNPPSNCADYDPVKCPTYAASNFCSNVYSINGVTIPKYCAKSCGSCSNCVDTHPSCNQWKLQGYCSLYPVYEYCKSTCNKC